jgi:prolyl oligopeptidase
MRRFPALFAAVLAVVLLLPAVALAERFAYPETARGDAVEVYHGTRVADPYRWLEEDVRVSERVRKWVEAQNEITLSYLEKIPQRPGIRKRLTELWDYERYESPEKVDGRYYFFKNDGLQNQSVLYAVDRLDGEPRPILNPNEWSEDGTVALATHAFSEDGRYLAYARSAAGSDWREWFVHDLAAGRDLPDRLRWVKFGEVSWTKDGKGFFYSRFPAPAEGEEYQALNTYQKVFYHRAGTPQSEDVLVYHRPDHPEWGFGSEVSGDGRYLIISVSKGTDDRNRVLYKDLAEPYGMPVELIGHFENDYSFVANDGPVFYFKTDLDALNGRLVAIDIREPGGRREIIPEAEQVLRGVKLAGNMFRASYLRDAVSYVRIFRTDGSHVRDVELPGIGSVSEFEGRRDDMETFYSFSSFNRPETIYRYDMVKGESTIWRQPEVDFDPDEYVVKQVFYRSKDKTRIPMFIAHRKGMILDGKRPTLLYGYGGFNIPMTPKFYVSRLAWMEMGGVFVMANLRGGGEYGEAWHRAGTKLKKQNVFDDFIAAAEWLIENRYTRPETLAIYGASNGGLLVGACMIQRPDLFGAALPAVGVMDMLRFHKFTAGRYWVDDYGSVEDPEEFKALHAYSPYHTLERGTVYPATLVTTADTDDRVVPAHSFKFAAALQHADAAAGDAPHLIRIQTSAGHGRGKPTRMKIEEVADLWAFLVANLEMDIPG